MSESTPVRHPNGLPGLPRELARLIGERAPVSVTVAGVEVPLAASESGLVGSLGGLRIHVVAEAASGGAVWRTAVVNEGSEHVDDITVIPLDLRLDLTGDLRVPRIRHLTGSWHFDAAYPPRAFRVSEEAFVTHDHTRPVALGGVNASRHSPLLQFALGSPIEFGVAVGLEWSGSWRLEAGWAELSFHGEPRPLFRIAGWSDLVQFSLAPGERVDAPAARVFGGAVSSWDDLSNRQRAGMRALRPTSGFPVMPVSYDTWFGRYERFTIDTLLDDAERAAGIGVEAFCLDACWYRSEHVYDGLGNWFTPDPVRFPGGAADVVRLADRVRALGMRFGLWHLIQLAAPDSDVVRARPDLFRPPRPHPVADGRRDEFGTTEIPGRGRFEGLELALERPESVEFALDVCERWITQWGVEWFRFESVPVDGADYTAGYDRLVDELRRRHPALYIEACNGGGQRLDLRSAVSTHGNWLSDHTSSPEVTRFTQTGALRFWPAHMLNLAVTAFPGAGDAQSSVYEVLSRMTGTLSFNGALAEWGAAATESVRHAVDVYKSIREDLDGDVEFPLPQVRALEDWDAVLFRPRGRPPLLFAFRVAGVSRQRLRLPFRVRRPSLVLSSDASAELQVTVDGVEIALGPRSAAIWRLE